ncbi:MAG: septum formation initiator family protein [Opitutaceae bacterium]|nr:septum formation initiator family protein [Opitutaceae bacterium]MDP3069323.1 septum formation initiator family protein [Opitutaceae bacterium]
MTSRRFIVLLYAGLLAGFGVWAGAMFLEARAEYRQLKQLQAAGEARLAAAQARFRDQEETLRRLKSDPDFVARVIRQQLGYGRPDEIIIRFDPAR